MADPREIAQDIDEIVSHDSFAIIAVHDMAPDAEELYGEYFMAIGTDGVEYFMEIMEEERGDAEYDGNRMIEFTNGDIVEMRRAYYGIAQEISSRNHRYGDEDQMFHDGVLYLATDYAEDVFENHSSGWLGNDRERDEYY